MDAIYTDLHIHTSENADKLNSCLQYLNLRKGDLPMCAQKKGEKAVNKD